MIRLSELKPGQTGLIEAIEQNDLGLKLMEMGFMVGERVTYLKKAPMGDPISVKIGNYLLSLRADEAVAVFVNLSV